MKLQSFCKENELPKSAILLCCRVYPTGGGSPVPEKPRIGISSCLLGGRVRYDGQHKYDVFLVETLGKYVEYVPVCPEVECGLPVPRERPRTHAGLLQERTDRRREAGTAGPIADMRKGAMPLLAPLTLLRHYVRKYNVTYLKDQYCLEPNPAELALLYHA
jgi:hypothetical protein